MLPHAAASWPAARRHDAISPVVVVLQSNEHAAGVVAHLDRRGHAARRTARYVAELGTVARVFEIVPPEIMPKLL